jgi:hypothetical protein
MLCLPRTVPELGDRNWRAQEGGISSAQIIPSGEDRRVFGTRDFNQDIRVDQYGFQEVSLLRRFPLRSCRTYAFESARSSRSLHIPTIAFIACLRLVGEAPYLSLTAARTSSEIDVRRCRDWMCSAFQISSSRYSCVRFMMYIIHRTEKNIPASECRLWTMWTN